MSILRFGPFNVTTQAFYQSTLSFALVNIKPLTKGHVLVCPKRYVTRVSQMSNEEAVDFYLTVHKVTKAIENFYKADSLNITIQDGPLAGQSVDHVHCHIIPRRLNDMPSGNVDEIYKLLDGKQGDLDHYFKVLKNKRGKDALGADNDARLQRSPEDMANEANELYTYMNNNDF